MTPTSAVAVQPDTKPTSYRVTFESNEDFVAVSAAIGVFGNITSIIIDATVSPAPFVNVPATMPKSNLRAVKAPTIQSSSKLSRSFGSGIPNVGPLAARMILKLLTRSRLTGVQVGQNSAWGYEPNSAASACFNLYKAQMLGRTGRGGRNHPYKYSTTLVGVHWLK